jgi:predicted transcriptional regulator
MNSRRKELQRIDWNIAKRIITVLYGERELKRTQIALKCNLSYANCLLYLEWLDFLGLIEKKIDHDNSELTGLTENGRMLGRKLQLVLEHVWSFR